MLIMKKLCYLLLSENNTYTFAYGLFIYLFIYGLLNDDVRGSHYTVLTDSELERM